MSGIVVAGKFCENEDLVCRKCGHAVYESATTGYRYQCPKCDEDLFGFETSDNKSDVLPEVTIAVKERGVICFPFLENRNVKKFKNQAEAEVYLLRDGAPHEDLGSRFLFIELWEDGTPIVLHGEIIGGGKVSMEEALKGQFLKDMEELRKENQEVHEAVIRKQKELLKMRMSMVTEECPECGSENTFVWSVVKDGYTAHCQKCGWPMMLCSECIADDKFPCDWNGENSLCYRAVEGFWKNMTDIPFAEKEDGSMILEKDYSLMLGTREVITFWAGTNREEIWKWFDERHPKGVVYLMYGEEGEGVENRTEEAD